MNPKILGKLIALSILGVGALILACSGTGTSTGGGAPNSPTPNVPTEFPIAITSGKELSISFAFDGTNYLVGIQGDQNFSANITAQLVSPSGGLVGSRISVLGVSAFQPCNGGSRTFATGGAPLVAFDGTNYLMVWADDCHNPSDHIAGQFISKSGVLVGAPFIINETGGSQEPGGVIFDGTNYFVVWVSQSDPANSDTMDIYGQFVTPSGGLLGSPIPISTAPHPQKDPAVAFDGTNIFVAWADGRNQSSCVTPSNCRVSDIFGQFVTKSGVSTPGGLSGANFSINSSNLSADYPVGIAFDGTNYLVTWNEDATINCSTGSCEADVYGQLVSKTGAMIGSKIIISNSPGNQLISVPTFNATGSFYLVTWTDGLGSATVNIKGKFFDMSGKPIGSELTIFSPLSDGRIPFLAISSWTTGSGYFSVIDRGHPGTDPFHFDSYTNADVFGATSPIPLNGNAAVQSQNGPPPPDYRVSPFYKDTTHAATSVSVTGPGMTTSMPLTFNANSPYGTNTWTLSPGGIDLGLTHPQLPLTYTFTITDSSGTSTESTLLTCIMELYATNLSPTGTTTGNVVFSWNGINFPNVVYQLQLADDKYNWVWISPWASGTSTSYSGPALVPGKTYNYFVATKSSSCENGGSQSVAGSASFVYQ